MKTLFYALISLLVAGQSALAGEARPSIAPQRAEIIQLQYLTVGKDFQPFFTPPWNRCSSDTLQALADLHFKAVSRSKGALPKSPPNLPDYQVNVDLHTRKEVTPHLALENLLAELEQGVSSGLCGVMIHHQRMNRSALEVLDLLLGIIKNNQNLIPVHFDDLP